MFNRGTELQADIYDFVTRALTHAGVKDIPDRQTLGQMLSNNINQFEPGCLFLDTWQGRVPEVIQSMWQSLTVRERAIAFVCARILRPIYPQT